MSETVLEAVPARQGHGFGSLLRATGILGSSSIVTILVGLITAKLWAVLIGPSGLGYMSLVQNLLSLGGMIAGFGIGTGVVRFGANALEHGDSPRLAATLRAAWVLTAILAGLGLLALVLFRVPLSKAMLGSSDHAGTVILVGIALVLSLASGLQGGIINAYHRISALAKGGALASILSAIVSLLLIYRWREAAIGPAAISTAAVGLLITTYFVRREVPRVEAKPTREEIWRQSRALMRFGGPYTASMLVGTGIGLVLPLLVLHSLGTADVGFYKAATALAGTYLAFLLTALGQDYYPRVSAVSDQPAALRELVNRQHRFIMLLGVPIILVALALVPTLIPLVYTSHFLPASDVLEWMLIGDIFKLGSWTMGYVILARSRSSTLLVTEGITGAAWLAGGWIGIAWLGLTGIGVAYLVAYIVHLAAVWVVVRREIGFVWDSENFWLMAAAVLAAGVIRGLPLVGLTQIRTPVALCLGAAATAYSAYVIYHELGGVRRVRAA